MTDERILELERKFKKKAKEYIDHCTKSNGFVILAEQIKADFIDLYVAGAIEATQEFEQQNKWHYPSKGDLPVPGKEYFVYMNDETIDIQQISINGDGEYYLNGINWAFSDVIAWKEIEPPKEVE